jgi:hypothetical protein
LYSSLRVSPGNRRRAKRVSASAVTAGPDNFSTRAGTAGHRGLGRSGAGGGRDPCGAYRPVREPPGAITCKHVWTRRGHGQADNRDGQPRWTSGITCKRVFRRINGVGHIFAAVLGCFVHSESRTHTHSSDSERFLRLGKKQRLVLVNCDVEIR